MKGPQKLLEAVKRDWAMEKGGEGQSYIGKEFSGLRARLVEIETKVGTRR